MRESLRRRSFRLVERGHEPITQFAHAEDALRRRAPDVACEDGIGEGIVRPVLFPGSLGDFLDINNTPINEAKPRAEDAVRLRPGQPLDVQRAAAKAL